MIPVARTLSAVQPREVTWIWPGYIPVGKLTIIEGDPGLGKSLVVADIVARVTRGAVMPDGRTSDLPGAANVIMLAAEDDASDTLRPRLEAAGADLNRVTVWETVLTDDETERLPVFPEDLGILADLVRRTHAKLVVVDPFAAYLSPAIDAWRDAEVRRALTPLATLAGDLGVAIVLVRHWTKAATSNPLHRGGGSIAIAAASRSVLAVAAHPDDEDVRVVASVKSNLAARPPSLAFAIEQRDGVPLVAWRGVAEITAKELAGSGGGREMSPERAAVIAYVAGRGEPVTPVDVANALGITVENARAHLSRAVKAGQLRRTATGRYALSESHQSHQSHESHESRGSVSLNGAGRGPSVTDVTGVTDVTDMCCPCGGTLRDSGHAGWLRCDGCKQYVRSRDPALERQLRNT